MEWKILPTKSVKNCHVSHEQLGDLRLVVPLFFTQYAASLYGYGSVRVYVLSKTGGNLSAILKNMSHVHALYNSKRRLECTCTSNIQYIHPPSWDFGKNLMQKIRELCFAILLLQGSH